jgi:hypothetical protein
VEEFELDKAISTRRKFQVYCIIRYTLPYTNTSRI